MTKLYKRIKKVARLRKTTEEAVARACGWQYNVISRWRRTAEQGVREGEPTATQIHELAQRLAVSLDWLMDESASDDPVAYEPDKLPSPQLSIDEEMILTIVRKSASVADARELRDVLIDYVVAKKGSNSTRGHLLSSAQEAG